MREREEATVTNLDLEAIAQILDEAPVTLAILYGSYARGDATATSDIDLAVEFSESLSSIERTQARLRIIERVTTRLETDEIDVVPLSQVSTELLEEILADGVLIYGSSEGLEQYEAQSTEATTHRNRIAEFDDLLTELERVV